jgi:hypothetical protein
VSICASFSYECVVIHSPNRSIANCSVFSLKLRFEAAQIARLLLFLGGWNGGPVVLAMDRTNWAFGGTEHNLLVVGAILGDSLVPLAWVARGKDGSSSGKERIALMRKLLKFWRKEDIEYLLADREFIGEEWLSWLRSENISCVTRLRGNLVVTRENGAKTRVDALCKGVHEGRSSQMLPVEMSGKTWQLQAKRTSDGLVMVLCHKMEKIAGKPVNLYRKRWRIECAFACLKRKGFELEDTHLQHANRLETLRGAVLIAFCWSLAIARKCKKPKIKNHGYPANCAFTLGKHAPIHALKHTEKISNAVAYAFNLSNVNTAVV